MKRWDKSLKKMDTLLGIMLDWLKECDDADIFAENMGNFQYRTLDSLGLDRDKYARMFAALMGFCCMIVKLNPSERYKSVKDTMLKFCKDNVKPDVE